MQIRPPIPALHTTKRFSLSLTVVLVALVSIILVATATFWLKAQIGGSGFTSDTARKQFVVGNDVLTIPLNLTRFPHQRGDTAQDQIDLVLQWPTGKGYSEDNSSFFLNPLGIEDIVFITLTKRKLQYDMSQRLLPIYRELFSGPAKTGPSGLLFQNLKSGSGYDGERLAIFNDEENTWVARCQDQNAKVKNPTCLRDINMGQSLSLQYRFSTKHLPQWREIEKMVTGSIRKILS